MTVGSLTGLRDVHDDMVAPSRHETGASVVEYVLLVGLIALVAFLAVTFFGDAVNESLSRSGSSLTGAAVP